VPSVPDVVPSVPDVVPSVLDMFPNVIAFNIIGDVSTLKSYSINPPWARELQINKEIVSTIINNYSLFFGATILKIKSSLCARGGLVLSERSFIPSNTMRGHVIGELTRQMVLIVRLLGKERWKVSD
jgi:hypothetical protein